MEQLRGALYFLMVLQTVASEDFRMFVTYQYNYKMVCIDARGYEIFNISLFPSAVSIAIDMFDKAVVSPSIVYSDAGAIYRMNMDGSNKEQLLDTTAPLGVLAAPLAIDPASRNIYYIGRPYITGSKGYIALLSPFGDHVFLVTTEIDDPVGLALHPAKGMLFWADNAYNGSYIAMADMTGTIHRKTFISGNIRKLWSLAMDLSGDMLYWTNENTIYRTDSLGQSTEVVLAGLSNTRVEILIDGGYLFFSNWDNSAIERIRLNDSSDRITFSNITGMKLSSFAVSSQDVLHTPRNIHCSAQNGDCSHVCIGVGDTYFCACESESATRVPKIKRPCGKAFLCEDSIPNGKITTPCSNLEQCKVKCNPGRYSDADKITCVIGKWNDSNPCKECEQGTWGDQCSKTCSCDFEKASNCNSITGSCYCKSGWAGENCTSCTIRNTICPSNSRCSNVAGSYRCTCETGYIPTTSGNCEECEKGTWGSRCSKTCSCDFETTLACNTTTGHCVCKSGWVGENCTFDIDECITGHAACPKYSDCNNVRGSFVCICQAGYFETASGRCEECTGNTFGENCSQICQCTAEHTVQPEQSCDHFKGACRCLATWTGEKCDVDVDECQMNTHNCNVSEHLVCQNRPGGFDCICKDCFPPGTAEEKTNIGMIIGISVGIPLGIIAVTVIICTLRLSKLKRTRRTKQTDERMEAREGIENDYLHPQRSNDHSEYSQRSEPYARIHETSITGTHLNLPKPIKEEVSGPQIVETTVKQTTDITESDSYMHMELQA